MFYQLGALHTINKIFIVQPLCYDTYQETYGAADVPAAPLHSMSSLTAHFTLNHPAAPVLYSD